MTDKMEILNERLFAVDAHTLFGAFSNPDHLEQWWGPHGFTNRIHEFDFRPGGTWRITMTASNGTDFDNRLTFREIIPGERLAFLHHEPMHVYTMEIRFVPETDGTRMHWRMLFEATEENLQLKKFIAAANEQNFDRLEDLLQQLNKGR
ncbi:SRPBCC domain-containing protein [Rhizobium sp. NTR19]|uniref:SRPBCC domain-containing protein n=1 Tax=Neorhizobium turbinariae TaxID=2937795 RepID=A0ABT0IKX2_9HYPH|nr:SRPBCC domain-containing protein [Neorhizobium turbinariae]MCK8778498.1 SRPBCC domain-containing protein [Neorhizobium turbinariae]